MTGPKGIGGVTVCCDDCNESAPFEVPEEHACQFDVWLCSECVKKVTIMVPAFSVYMARKNHGDIASDQWVM